MSDYFEQAKDEILLRAEENGGPTTHDLLILLSAKARDDDAQHAEAMDAIRKHGELLATHCAEEERRLGKLEAWKNEHCVMHDSMVSQSPRRSGDDPAHDYKSVRRDGALLTEPIARKVWVLWGVFIFILVEVSQLLMRFVFDSFVR